MPSAFVLGAGLGTRLRPLTLRVPKPLLAVAHRTLLDRAFGHLRADPGIDRFVVNTHHLPDRFREAVADGTWNGMPVALRHEPVLLDTGGGLANIRDLVPEDESLVVYNGDILCDAPLRGAWRHHLAGGAEATLVLRRSGPLVNVACRAAPGDGPHACGPVVDIRGLLGVAAPLFQFTGIFFVAPGLLEKLPPAGRIFPIVPFLVRRIELGARIDGIVVDDGCWWDLGTPRSVFDAHDWLAAHPFPRHAPEVVARAHPEASVAPGTLDGRSWAGPGVRVPETCSVRASILLEGCALEPGVVLERCLVAPGYRVERSAREAVLA